MTSTSTSASTVPVGARRTDEGIGSVELVAEVATALVSVTLVATTARLFTDASPVAGWILVVLAIHVVGFLTRRAGLRAGWSLLAHLVVGILVISWSYLGFAVQMGVPTSRTIDAARAAVEESFIDFRTLVAPVEPSLGFELVLATAFAIFASFTQLASFRGRAPMQAILPPAGAFVAMSVFALDRSTAVATGAFLGAVLLHLSCHRTLRLTRERWATGSLRGAWSLIGTAAVIIAGASLLGSLVGPAFPGAGDEAVVDLRAIGRRRPPLEVGNPLVGVTNLLGEQSDREMFRVSDADPTYWRLTALETYDPFDQQWKTRRSYADVGSGDTLRPSTAVPSPVAVSYDVRVIDLPGVWLPSPYSAERVTADVELRYDDDSGSVIVGGRGGLPPIEYRVRAAMPSPDPADAPDEVNRAEVPAEYSEDPFLTASAMDWLEEVEGSLPPDADVAERARVLQDAFRGFTYDLEVDYSGEADPVGAFLRDRRGFCQQFASVFAQMARVWGVPSRVAVGFTWGDAATVPDADGEIPFVVRGRNAHAWPELYLGPTMGWVAFEPTPGRGNPASSEMTGVDAAQEPPPSAPETPAPTTTVAGTGEVPPPGVTTTTTTLALPSTPGSTDPEAAEETEGSWWTSALTWVAALVLAAAAVLGGWIGAVAWTRDRRRRTAVSAAARVELAWDDSRTWLAHAGTPQRRTETPTEFARRVPETADLGVEAAGGLLVLGGLETRRIHSTAGVSEEDAARAQEIAEGVGSLVEGRLSPVQRFLLKLGL